MPSGTRFWTALAAMAFAAHPALAGGQPKAASASAVCASPGSPIDEAGFVPIGGIEQWVTISGRRCGNPMVLFVHGGPGNPLSPYADALFSAWEDDFTIVQWDQRGAGRTYGRKPPGEGVAGGHLPPPAGSRPRGQ